MAAERMKIVRKTRRNCRDRKKKNRIPMIFEGEREGD